MTPPTRVHTLLWPSAVNDPSVAPEELPTLVQNRRDPVLDEMSLAVDAVDLQRRIAVASDETMDVVLDSMRMSEGLTLPTLRAAPPAPVAQPRALPAMPGPPTVASSVGPRVTRTIPLPPQPQRPRPAASRAGVAGVARALLALTAATVLTASYAALAGALPVTGAVLARDVRRAPPAAVEPGVAPAVPSAPPAEEGSAKPSAPTGSPVEAPVVPPAHQVDTPPPYEPSHPSTSTGAAIEEIQAVLDGAGDAVGVLEIAGDPDEALYVNGRLVGWGPRVELAVEPGSYGVVGRDGGDERAQFVDVRRDRRTVVRVGRFTR